jgi:GxxExxY protein
MSLNPTQSLPGLKPAGSQMRSEKLPRDLEDLVHRVIGLAIEVHRTLGPGMLESLYEEALCYELTRAGIRFERQKCIEVPYKETVLKGQRLDLLVEGRLLLELKSVTQITALFEAQTLGYLRAIDLPLALLLNFNAVRMADGFKRVLNTRWSQFRPTSVLGSDLPSLPSLR